MVLDVTSTDGAPGPMDTTTFTPKLTEALTREMLALDRRGDVLECKSVLTNLLTYERVPLAGDWIFYQGEEESHETMPIIYRTDGDRDISLPESLCPFHPSKAVCVGDGGKARGPGARGPRPGARGPGSGAPGPGARAQIVKQYCPPPPPPRATRRYFGFPKWWSC